MTATGQRIVVPAYSYPSPTTFWDGLIETAGPVELIIANPADGPGAVADSNYVRVLARVREAGIRVLGYVDTSYGARRPAVVEAEIDAWDELYGVSDIFLDQTASGPGLLSYYRTIGDHVHAVPGALTLFNPGNNVDEGYLEAADILNVFEGTMAQFAGFRPAAWSADHPRSRFAHLVYDVPDKATMTAVLRDSAARHAGYVYVTSADLPNPWDVLPPYWSSEVEQVVRTT